MDYCNSIFNNSIAVHTILNFISFTVISPPGNDTRPDLLVFGPEVGDQMLPPVDDGSSPEIVLNTSFVFFGYNYTRLYVSNFLLHMP